MRILLLILAALLPVHASAAAVATWPNFVVTPGGGGAVQAVTNYFAAAGSGTTIVTNISGTNVTWTFTSSGGGGGGNMTNSGASTAGNVAVATDSTGTQWTSTNSITLDSIIADLLFFSNLTPNGFAYLGSLTNLTNSPYIPMPASANLTNWSSLSTNVIGASGVVGTVSNAVASAGLLAVDASKTNGIAATSAMVSALQTNATLQSLGGVTTNAPNIAVGSLASFSASNQLQAATSAQLTNTFGIFDGSPGKVVNGLASLARILDVLGQYNQLTPADAGVALAFDSSFPLHIFYPTGNVTFTFSGLATNRGYMLRVVNTNTTNIMLTWPAGAVTNFYGGVSTNLVAGRRMRYAGSAFGTTDADVDNAVSFTQ